MSTRFGNDALTDHVYFVGLDNGAQAVGDSDCRPALLGCLESLLDDGFRV